MLVTARPSFPPGVVAAATAPIAVLFASALLVAWSGGPEEVSRITHASGPFASLVMLSGLVELAFLTVMVCHTGSGRMVPLAVMLGMATLPWTVGLLGSEAIVSRTVTALGELEAPDARSALALGVGQAMASRMLGAWMSTALLVGLGLGLAIAGASSNAPWLPTPRGRTASLMFGVVVAFVLAALSLAGALEAHALFEGLSRVVRTPVTEQINLLSTAAQEMSNLSPIRKTCEVLLAGLGAVLLIWQVRRAAPPAQGWMGSAFLVAAVAALLVLDGHPLRLAEQSARAAGLSAPTLPSDFQTLSTLRASTPRPLAALVTLEGVVPSTGPRLPWSAPARTLAEALSSSLHSTALGQPALSGATPEPVLPLLADARLSGSAMRQLLRASSLAGARSVVLMGQQPHAAPPAMLEWFESRRPLFSLLAARVGMLQLLLPSALPQARELSWRARMEPQGQLHLSSTQGSGTLTLSLQAAPAEIPEVLAGTFVGLEVSDTTSLSQLSAAVDVLELAGAAPVAVLDPDSREALPANGGTDTLWSSPLLWKWQVLRKGQGPRRAQTPLRRAPRPAVAAHSSEMNRTMAATRPTPNTTSITTPSELEDRGTFGTASEPGFTSRATGAAGTASGERSSESLTTEASRSSRPSRASARTLLMWSM